MYQKEIVYMSLFEDDIKVNCVGYLKQEKRGEEYNIELQVKNAPNKFTGNFPIRIQGISGWKEPAPLAINDGKGIWTGSASEPVIKAEVLLPDSYRIKGESRNIQEIGIKSNKENEHSETNGEIRENKYSAVNAEIRENRHTEIDEKVKDDKVLNNNTETIVNTSKHQDAEILKADLETKPQPRTANNSKRIPKADPSPLYENKWEQLLAAYEQIHPYGDNRIYIKLEPKDFIVLRSNYQHLVNNSFLLHGFYNYRYVILGKEKDYYIGVPGVFYEREKMVALMFGFEAFECEGGEAEEGKFGYYLRKVEI